MNPQQVLQRYWHYNDFRPGQLEIIQAIIGGQDVLAILPTGGGKSICFQVPGIIRGLTLVVSPLISLMKDQVDQLQRRGIRAIFYDSNLSTQQRITIEKDLITNQYQFLYVSPERLQNRNFQRLCQNQLNLKLIAIDEAHCLSLWGHDFRPSYLMIKDFLRLLPERPPVAAFTATTTPACTADILKFLELSQPKVFQNSFARENLYLNVIHCSSLHQKKLNLLRLLKKHQQQMGIIYCSTRIQTEKLAQWLNQLSIIDTSVAAYHGALEQTQRAKIQDDFISEKTKLIIATNAFGMGVDAPRIRFVIHYQPSANIENYYQEVGRAGRDGKRGDCYFLLHHDDWQIPTQFIDRMSLDPHHPQQTIQIKKLLLHKLQQIKSFTKLHRPRKLSFIFSRNSLPCRQKFILAYFADQKQAFANCGHCDLCANRKFTPSPREKQLLDQLKKWRQKICSQLNHDLIPALLLPKPFLEYLNLLQPTQSAQLATIPGFGRGLKQQTELTTSLTNFFQSQRV